MNAENIFLSTRTVYCFLDQRTLRLNPLQITSERVQTGCELIEGVIEASRFRRVLTKVPTNLGSIQMGQ